MGGRGMLRSFLTSPNLNLDGTPVVPRPRVSQIYLSIYPAMSAADALPAGDRGAAGADIAACTAMLGRLTPSALRDDPALAPLREAGVKLFGPEVLRSGWPLASSV